MAQTTASLGKELLNLCGSLLGTHGRCALCLGPRDRLGGASRQEGVGVGSEVYVARPSLDASTDVKVRCEQRRGFGEGQRLGEDAGLWSGALTRTGPCAPQDSRGHVAGTRGRTTVTGATVVPGEGSGDEEAATGGGSCDGISRGPGGAFVLLVSRLLRTSISNNTRSFWMLPAASKSPCTKADP
ncbi:hypothetical protein CB1_000331027 [Camelus ferus]|nr:hypothetical protein CB1_000331027 [Camelus ferus]